MSSKKLHLAVSTYIQQKTFFPRRILAYSDFLGQTSDLKQNYHPEIIANVLFSGWLRLSVFYGVSEKEWQKMDHYLVEILTAVRSYIKTIIKK